MEDDKKVLPGGALSPCSFVMDNSGVIRAGTASISGQSGARPRLSYTPPSVSVTRSTEREPSFLSKAIFSSRAGNRSG